MKSYTLGITKEQFVAETKLHAELDHFIRGTYGEGEDKGCAVGCAIKSINKLRGTQIRECNHEALESHGICPDWLARVQDAIFEGVSFKRSKTWPVEFAESINEGSNLDEIKAKFIIYILKCNIKIQKQNLGKGVDEVVLQTIAVNEEAISLWSAAESAESAAWSAAESAAWSAAESAARSAAWSARSAAESVAWSAESAAWSAAWSAAESAARSAAESAESAAESAAWSAAESAAWSAAESAAMSAAYEQYADKLLQLMKECK